MIISRDVYEKYVYNFYDDRHVKFYNQDFFSNSVFMNWNIMLSSMSGQVLWTKMLRRNSKTKNKNYHKKESIITLILTTGQKVSNKSFCGSYFRMF